MTDANTGGRHYLKRTILYEPSQVKSPKVGANPASRMTSYQMKLEISGLPVQYWETNHLLDRVVGGSDFIYTGPLSLQRSIKVNAGSYIHQFIHDISVTRQLL